MSSIFTKIIQGEIPSHKIAEDENCYAFLDIHPLAKGHTLVVPKKEVDYIFDLDEETLSQLMAFSKKVASKIENVITCERIGISVVGLEVPHAHIHLIPINSVSDMNFERPKLEFEEQTMIDIAKAIREA